MLPSSEIWTGRVHLIGFNHVALRPIMPSPPSRRTFLPPTIPHTVFLFFLPLYPPKLNPVLNSSLLCSLRQVRRSRYRLFGMDAAVPGAAGLLRSLLPPLSPWPHQRLSRPRQVTLPSRAAEAGDTARRESHLASAPPLTAALPRQRFRRHNLLEEAPVGRRHGVGIGSWASGSAPAPTPPPPSPGRHAIAGFDVRRSVTRSSGVVCPNPARLIGRL
jgi:hypothetical protein